MMLLCIYNLEAFERSLTATQSIDEVVTLLSQQAPSSAKTLERIVESLIERVAERLQRPLSDEEEQKLRRIKMVEEAMHYIEDLAEAPDEH